MLLLSSNRDAAESNCVTPKWSLPFLLLDWQTDQLEPLTSASLSSIVVGSRVTCSIFYTDYFRETLVIVWVVIHTIGAPGHQVVESVGNGPCPEPVHQSRKSSSNSLYVDRKYLQIKAPKLIGHYVWGTQITNFEPLVELQPGQTEILSGTWASRRTFFRHWYSRKQWEHDMSFKVGILSRPLPRTSQPMEQPPFPPRTIQCTAED